MAVEMEPAGRERAGTGGPRHEAAPWRERVGGLTEDLFPLAPPMRGGTLAAGGGLAWLLLVIASVLRQTGVSALDSVWAEDGSIFLQEAIAWPLSDRLLTTYAGYLHLLPRALAELVTVVPVSRAATALTLASAGITALCAVGVFVATGGHIRDARLRAVLGAAVVLQPIAGAEALNTIALLQWHLTATAVWFALWRPRERIAVCVQGVLLTVAVLSSPVALVVVPILLARVVLLRDRRSAILTGVTGTAALVQLAAMVTAPPAPPMTEPVPSDAAAAVLLLGEVFGLRVAAPALLGVRVANRVLGVLGPVPLALLATVVLVGAAGWVIGGRSSVRRATGLVLSGVLVTTFGLAVVVRGVGEPMRIAAYLGDQAGSRYVLVPVLLALSLLALALDQPPPPRLASVWGRVVTTCVVGAALLAVVDFPVRNARSAAPAWSGEVNQAVQDCRTVTALATLDGAPGTDGSFSVRIACSELPP